jgi:hypothetical protein
VNQGLLVLGLRCVDYLHVACWIRSSSTGYVHCVIGRLSIWFDSLWKIGQNFKDHRWDPYQIFNWLYVQCVIHPDIPINKNGNNELWKLRIPLRIKVFRWYLWKGVFLTKDNLPKWNWHGSKKCVFCHHDETRKHLFFQCRFARSIWSIIQLASTLYRPSSVANIFGNSLNRIDHRFKKHIRVGVIAIIWLLWLCRNDEVFNNKTFSLLQVNYRCTNPSKLLSHNARRRPSARRMLLHWLQTRR